jgi:hypothetical protein
VPFRSTDLSGRSVSLGLNVSLNVKLDELKDVLDVLKSVKLNSLRRYESGALQFGSNRFRF